MPTVPELATIELDHVALGLASVDESAELLVGRLGGRPFGGGPGIEFSGIQWQFARGELIEVIQPEAPAGGFLERFLAARGPGIHHVTFKVPRIEAAAERVAAFGYEVVGYRADNPGWKELFVHPKQAQGIVVQLAESHPDLDVAPWGPDWPFPGWNGSRPEAAELVGLRMAADDQAASLRQWRDLLQAEVQREGDLLVFRWPGSPMRITVEAAAGRPIGPLGFEVRARADLGEAGAVIDGGAFRLLIV